MSLGRYIRERREASGIGLRKFAQQAELDPAYFSRIELDKTKPTEEVLTRIAAILGVDRDVLIVVSGSLSSEMMASIQRFPEAFVAHLRRLKEVPEEEVRRVTLEVRDGEW